MKEAKGSIYTGKFLYVVAPTGTWLVCDKAAMTPSREGHRSTRRRKGIHPSIHPSHYDRRQTWVAYS